MSQTPAAPGKFGSGRFHRPNPYGGSSVTGVMSMPFGSQNNNNSTAPNSARKSPHSRQGSSADPGSDSETLTTVSSDNFSSRLAEITKGGPPAFDYENEIKKEEVLKEANKELFEFPKDDIKEVELPREFRTELDPEIKDWQHARDKEKLLPHVKDCVEFYLTKWRGYTRTCADLGLKTRSESDSNLTSLLYEDSIEESQQESSTGASASGGPSSSGLGASSGRDVVRTDLLESYKPKTTDGLNEKNRLLGRNELYHLNPAADAAVATERVPPFKPKPVRRFLIEPKDLKFELGNVEPYFCTMALYDISKKVRISENYYFELNGAEVSDMLGEHRIKTKPCKRALFSVSSPSPDIFIVVRIEKVLHGDYDESVESYVKFDNVKDKDREKIERDVKERCARLGQWRQPFCVGILPLFNAEDRSMSVITSGTKDPHQITMKNIYRYRGDVGDLAFFEQMPEKGSSSSKKMKPLNGCMTLEIRELAQSDVTANTNAKPANMQEVLVSPCSLPVHPDVKVPSSEYIQEVQEFPQTLTAFPNLEYVNNLYLYPEMVNLTKTNGQKSARNIAVSVQFLETDDVTSKLRALWNKNSAEPEMTDHVFTAVQYHNKAPQFYDEIKIKLPLHLTPRHNLLFTFYHVPCQLKKPSEPTIVGYAFIPIMVKGRIMEKEIQIPIASELPNKFLSKEASEAIKASLIDSKKITFKFRLRLVSTVHASDKHVNQFFVDNKKHKLDRTALATSLAQLTKAKPRVVIQFMPVLFTQLLQLIAQGSELSREALQVLVTLIANMHNESLDSKSLLEKYVEHVFVDPKKSETNSSALQDENGWVYYELLKQWLAVVKEKTAALPQGVIAASASMTVQSSDKNSTPASVSELEKYHKYSWFLFKIVYKSMCDRLAALHLLQDQSTRQKRFGAECERAVRSLCVLLAYQIQTQLKKTLSVFKDLNRSLAHYLTDMLAVMDRGVVLDVIQHVIKELSPSTEPQLQLLDVKLEHIKILVLHEHWIELNLPLHHALTLTNLPKLLELYAQRHVLAGVVLRVVFELSINHDKPLRLKALAVLHQLFMRHDHDHRYNKRGVKQRIAELYFPFVLHVIDNLAFYREADFDEQRSAFLLWCYIVKNCSAHLMRDWWKIDTVTRLVGFLNALSFAARVFEHVGREAYLEKMNRESESKSNVMAMFEEKYQDQPSESDSRNKSLRERRIEARSRGNTVGGGTAPSQNPTPGHTPQPSSSGVSVSSSQSGSIKDPKRWRASYASEVDKRFDYNSERESHLSHEVSMILLDALECFVAAKESELVESHQPNLLLDQVFKVLKTSLKMKQSVTYLTHAYATLRTFIYKFPKALFTLNTQYCAKLCNLVLAHCNYNNNAVRSEASAVIYLFMKKNFEATKRKNFTRIKVATTIALSKLVGEGEVSDPAYLRRALDVLPEYVRTDLKGSDAELENQAIQLVQRLKTILEDSVKSIRHAKNKDNEMLADLYHHIAQSYNNAPDLRVTWLKSLASLHEKNKAWAEAGIAVVHIAALIAEFLNLAEPSPGLPVGCAAFEHVSHSALEEVLESSGDLLGGVTDDEATTELQIFTEDGLVKVMCQAIDYLKQAELYEACNELYKLLLPIFEKNRDYLKLSAAHLDLKEIFDKIILSMQNESRFLGSYYRVAFFGNLFEELSGQEFIYKEPKLTRLGEISDRLVNLYQKKFGEGVKVQLLTTSADVDVSKLDLDKQCYLQITSVDPYFEPWELKDRVTHYDRSYNITSFIFETPFTKDGKQQSGDLSKQYKRKTILQVETAFPYMKTRLKITKKHSVELAPIENALETVEKRIQKLQNELRNPNAKTLMGVLQGTVSPQVHAGSTEVAKAFLSDASKGQYDSEQVESIRRALQEFLEVCADALNRSSQLINPDQIPFQKELEEGFKAMKAIMETYLAAK